MVVILESQISAASNQWVVFRQILTNISITGTSINTPTTVASAAPEDSPKSMVAVAMATSKRILYAGYSRAYCYRRLSASRILG